MENLSLILDGILILILVASIFDGRRKGFVKTVLSLAVTVISVIIAKEFAEPLADWINTNFIHDMGVNWLTNIISENISSGTQAVVDAIPRNIAESVAAFAKGTHTHIAAVCHQFRCAGIVGAEGKAGVGLEPGHALCHERRLLFLSAKGVEQGNGIVADLPMGVDAVLQLSP